MTLNIEKQTSERSAPASASDRILPHLSGLDQGPGAVVARARECPADHIIDWHTHERAQLLYAVRGVMRVTTDNGVWVVPPQRAVWIPPGISHHVQAQGTALSLRSLYIRKDAHEGLPEVCCVVTVSPLLRELILEAMRLSDDPGPDSAEARLIGVLLDRVEGLPVAPLHLPMTTDKRARKITDTLMDDPSDMRTLQDWSQELGASERTLARIFSRETGMTFGQWRQQVKLLAALARLARGDSVTDVAFDLGYASQSAFIAMFRRALGKTPGRYFTE
ncbi:helix-turn-helix transcriptional regulator [Thalassospiraceae bacterium LMO-JJ14]|nr:helix-turn-helix transcriptional regulator [Thalassospiraceae bacterium LMO-JJ14]